MSDPSRGIALTCKSCGHGWSVTPPTGVSLSEWVAELQRHACPSCGALYRVTSQPTKSDKGS
jgi:hypothetical protein